MRYAYFIMDQYTMHHNNIHTNEWTICLHSFYKLYNAPGLSDKGVSSLVSCGDKNLFSCDKYTYVFSIYENISFIF